MSDRTTDTTHPIGVSPACPVCHHPYEDKTIIRTSDEFDNQFPGAFFVYVAKYQRKCVSRLDTENDRVMPRTAIVVYFHREREL